MSAQRSPCGSWRLAWSEMIPACIWPAVSALIDFNSSYLPDLRDFLSRATVSGDYSFEVVNDGYRPPSHNCVTFEENFPTLRDPNRQLLIEHPTLPHRVSQAARRRLRPIHQLIAAHHS